MTLQCGLAIASMSAPQLELITARWRMDLEDAYGWLAVPAKILEVCENVLSDIGVPVGPWLAQSIVLMVAAALAAAFAIWFFRTEKRGLPRFAILVIVLGLFAISLPIPIFWIRFLIAPPKGEIVGSISADDAASWRIAIIDNRGAKIADATVSDAQGLFTAYYTPTLGQFPARIEANRQGCVSRSTPLDRGVVFDGRMLDLELTCQSPSE